MIVHIDARKLTDSAGLHAALSEAFGFPLPMGKTSMPWSTACPTSTTPQAA